MNILEKVTQFTKELAAYIGQGAPNVTTEEYEERLKTCNDCEHITEKFTCNQCGCNMTIKSKWATSNCPKNKWPEIKKK